MTCWKRFFGMAALLAGGFMAAVAQAAESSFINIGTAGVTGVYFPAGGAICRFVNKGSPDHGIRCAVEPTGGSMVNLRGIRGGTIDFALVQSDWQYYAYTGSASLRDVGPFRDLRAVFSLHVEPFTIVARVGSKIRQFGDLKGKRVNIGNPGSGQRGTMDVVMQTVGLRVTDFESVFELSADEQSKALCNDAIDAMVFMSGFPSGTIKEATTVCAATLVDVEGEAIDGLVGGNVFYRKALIPKGVYAGTDRDIRTFGTLATLVTSTRIPDEIVYQLTKSAFENLDEFKKQHPAFKDLKEQEMIRDGLAAPLHAGAVRYYEEKGWTQHR